MYKSKKKIERKLEQVKYNRNLIRRYHGQVLAGNGRDPSTGAHPLMVHISALISQGRSIVQYAYKEAEETGHLADFESFAAKSDIFKLGGFKFQVQKEQHDAAGNRTRPG